MGFANKLWMTCLEAFSVLNKLSPCFHWNQVFAARSVSTFKCWQAKTFCRVHCSGAFFWSGSRRITHYIRMYVRFDSSVGEALFWKFAKRQNLRGFVLPFLYLLAQYMLPKSTQKLWQCFFKHVNKFPVSLFLRGRNSLLLHHFLNVPCTEDDM